MRYLTEGSRARMGMRIKQARKQAGLSHDRLAGRVGTSRQHLIKLENGQHFPRREMLAAIADATGKSVEFFESDEDEEAAQVSLDEILRRVVRDKVEAELRKLGVS